MHGSDENYDMNFLMLNIECDVAVAIIAGENTCQPILPAEARNTFMIYNCELLICCEVLSVANCVEVCDNITAAAGEIVWY